MSVTEERAERQKMERAADTPRIVHYESMAKDKTSLCGAPVLGIRTPGRALECVVCAEMFREMLS